MCSKVPEGLFSSDQRLNQTKKNKKSTGRSCKGQIPPTSLLLTVKVHRVTLNQVLSVTPPNSKYKYKYKVTLSQVLRHHIPIRWDTSLASDEYQCTTSFNVSMTQWLSVSLCLRWPVDWHIWNYSMFQQNDTTFLGSVSTKYFCVS